MKRTMLLAVCFLAAVGPLSAGTLAWRDAVSTALEHNPSIRKAQETLTAAKQTYVRSRSNFLPQLTATAGTSQSDSSSAGFGREASLGLSARLSIFSGFSDISELRSREADIRIAEAAYTRALADVMLDVRKSFIELLWAQESGDLARKILERRSENLEMIQLRYESGREDKGSLLRVLADLSSTEFDLDQAQRARSLAATALLRAMGRADDTDVAAEGSLEPSPVPADVPFPSLVSATPEYRQAHYNLNKAEIGVISAKSALYPELSLSAGTSRSGTSFWPDGSRWNAGLTLSYPLFTGGKTSGGIAIARTQKNIAGESLKQTELTLEMKLRRSLKSLTDAHKLISIRKQFLEASALQSEIVRSKYMNGLSSYQDWYTIENDYISARKALLNATREAALDEAQWKNDLGLGE